MWRDFLQQSPGWPHESFLDAIWESCFRLLFFWASLNLGGKLILKWCNCALYWGNLRVIILGENKHRVLSLCGVEGVISPRFNDNPQSFTNHILTIGSIWIRTILHGKQEKYDGLLEKELHL